jgi:methionyl-tRNA synthetase
VRRYHEEQKGDFAKFDVAFDHFGITHNDTRRRRSRGSGRCPAERWRNCTPW